MYNGLVLGQFILLATKGGARIIRASNLEETPRANLLKLELSDTEQPVLATGFYGDIPSGND